MRISAIGEPAAGRDEQLGQIFRNMRLAMKLSREAMARRLATSAFVVDSFEAGAVTALPHWKETARIVGGYCELMRLDSEPILWRIRSQLQAVANHARPKTVRSAAPLPPVASVPGRRTVRASERPERRRRRARTLFVLSAPIALLAGMIYMAQATPGQVYGAIALLPQAVASPLRVGVDYLVLLTAPRRDGLKWVEVGDPRLRKADKLQTGTR
jgi:hypothetical protein